jgi:tetratricopeptide (TPR) repeat protein
LPPSTIRLGGGVALLVAVLVLGSLTVARNRVYHSGVAMWTDVIEKTRHSGATFHRARALSNLGDQLLDAGRVEEGVEVLRQAVKLNPAMAQIHGNLGRGLLDIQDFAAAQHHGDEAVRLDPKGARFRQQLGLLAAAQGRLDEAEAHLRQALALAPSDGVIETNLAKCLADQHEFDEAIERLWGVVRRDPKFAEARRRLATALATAGRFEEAAEVARELASRFVQDARPCLLLGLIELQQPDEEAALRWFAEALQRDPKCTAAHLHSGNVRRRRGERAEAVSCYEKAVAIDEESAEAQNNLGGLLAQDEPRRAARHFQAAVKARPDFLEARFNLAATLARLGVADQAAEQYRAVLQIQPDFAPARAGLEALAAGAKPP